MIDLALAIALASLGQGPPAASETAANPLYKTALDEGLVVEGVTVKLPPPVLHAGMSEAERKAALKAAVDLPMDEFLRDSVNAPFKIKLRDVPYPTGTIRVVDLWFALHAGLDEVNLDDLAGKKDADGKEVGDEVANMSFSGRILGDAELKARSIAASTSGLDRYAFTRGVLLDRVKVTSVNHVVGARAGAGALLIASRTDPAFDVDAEPNNRWVLLPVPGEAKKEIGPPRPYAGSVFYSRVGQFSEAPAVLLIETHLAYAEPKAWFNGASILRSKLSLIAQDQIRKLRREVAARRKKDGRPATAKP